jgi:hypothetical protein
VREIYATTHSLWMYTMNRCFPPSPIRLSATNKVAAYAIFSWATALFSIYFAAGLPTVAHAQTDGMLSAPDQIINPGAFVGRQFPAKAQRGTLQVVQGAEILIDGNPERLAPGARVRGPNNALVMTGALDGQRYVVNYVREAYGNVHQVWILTELEKRQKLKTVKPESNFSFGSGSDTPKVDDGKTPFNQLPKFKQ